MEERFFQSDVKTKEEVGRELRVWPYGELFGKCLKSRSNENKSSESSLAK
jgi:hypothetical protein